MTSDVKERPRKNRNSLNRPRLGRPPKVSAEQIAEKALELGLGQADVRNLAQALDMSVPGLYHHVRTRDELVELATAHALQDMMRRAPEGGRFADLLTYFAHELFELYASHPPIMASIWSGQLTMSGRSLLHMERLITEGVGAGLSPSESYEVFVRVMTAVLGAAVMEASRRSLLRQSSSFLGEIGTALKGDFELPGLHSLIVTDSYEDVDNFETVRIVLKGLRQRFGDKLDGVDDAEQRSGENVD